MRTVNALPATHQDRQMVLLQDPLGIAKKSVLIPPEVTPLLILCDGTRTLAQIHADLLAMYGFEINPNELEAWLNLFDEAALLENQAFVHEKDRLIEEFRGLEARPMTLANDIYPLDPKALKDEIDPYLTHAHPSNPDVRYSGLICPHIDYFRGWRVYAEVMAQARESIQEAELIIILGTDHFDDGNPLSMTKQSYQTPYGILPTPLDFVEELQSGLPEIDLFQGELRHRYEHSIELALVWVHHMRAGKTCDVLPLLCGSNDLYFEEDQQTELPWLATLTSLLKKIQESKKTLIVAAADLAHVGRAFGGEAVATHHRTGVALADEKLLNQVKTVNPQAFIQEIYDVNDRYNVCGISPIYLLLKLMTPSKGKVVSYELCPADQDETSWVSICGALIS